MAQNFKKCAESSFVKQVLDNNPAGMLITDVEGRIQYVNNAFEKLTGWKQKECIGKTPRIIKSGLQPLGFYKKLWRTIKKNKKAWTGEVVNKKKNGELFNSISQIFPILDEKRKIKAFAGFQTDITQLVSEKEKTKELALFPEENPTPVFRINTKGNVLYANPAAKAFLKTKSRLVPVILKMLEEKKNCVLEWTFGKKTFNFLCVVVEQKKYINVYGTDITQIKHAEKTLLKNKEMIEKEVLKKTQELQKKLAELELFKESVVSAELDLKRLEDENEMLREKIEK